MLHTGIFEHLRTAPETSSYLAVPSPGLTRVFNGVVPQKRAGSGDYMPCVVYNLRGVDRTVGYCGTSGLVRSNIVLDHYALTYEQAKLLASAVKDAMIDYSGLLGGIVTVRHAALQTEFDVVDAEPGLFRVSQSWFIWHVE